MRQSRCPDFCRIPVEQTLWAMLQGLSGATFPGGTTMKQLIRGVMTGVGLAAVMLTASLAAQGPVKVEMKDGQGQSIGTATLTQSMGMVHIQLDLKNLKPGQHALHVHMTPKCEGPEFTSAGGHFNP